MLTIVLRILSVLGILLLALCALAVTILLLVLFVPVTYRISGVKDEEGFRINGKVNWLFGIFRLRYGYPEPGELTAKILFLTLYRMKIPPDATEDDSSKPDAKERKKKKPAGSGASKAAAGREASNGENPSVNAAAEQKEGKKPSTDAAVKQKAEESPSTDAAAKQKAEESPSTDAAAKQKAEESPSTDAAEQKTEESPSVDAAQKMEENDAKAQEGISEDPPADALAEETAEENLSGFGKILQKFRKIKYTIHGIYDKIKEIWNNISYYLELLQEEETRQLFSHVRLRTGKIMKSMRPGHIRADILFGTGAPDTTGYLYGAYCMLPSMLRADICVTPDFEEAVLRAEFDISGHIAIWVLAVNAGRIALDKRLWRLIKKAVSPEIKTARKKAA